MTLELDALSAACAALSTVEHDLLSLRGEMSPNPTAAVLERVGEALARATIIRAMLTGMVAGLCASVVDGVELEDRDALQKLEAAMAAFQTSINRGTAEARLGGCQCPTCMAHKAQPVGQA